MRCVKKKKKKNANFKKEPIVKKQNQKQFECNKLIKYLSSPFKIQQSEVIN